MAQRSCASRSLSEKYQWPDAGCEKFESSPSTHSTPRPRSRSTRTSRFKRVTLYTSRTAAGAARPSGFMAIKHLSTGFTAAGGRLVVGKKAVGIVTHRDLRFEDKLEAPVSSVMTPKERLVTVREDAPKDQVLALLHKHRIEKLLVVNGDHELVGMITVKDFQKANEFPHACKDDGGRLRVGAAGRTTPDTLDRVAALTEARV